MAQIVMATFQGYEKEVKSYVYTLEGAPATTKMQLPKDARQTREYFNRVCVAVCLQ